MTDSFVPLKPAAGARSDSQFTSFAVPVAPASDASARPAFDALLAASSDPSHSPDVCARPSVTLQRNGDTVTAIRIQCGCGRVTELNCVY
jgi:hypothetical protein